MLFLASSSDQSFLCFSLKSLRAVLFFGAQAEDLYAKWEASSWAKKKARKVKRSKMTDFDRFKVRVFRRADLPHAPL